MAGFLAFLLCEDGSSMGRKLFKDEEDAKTWIKGQRIPWYGLAWYLETYDAEGTAVSTHAILTKGK